MDTSSIVNGCDFVTDSWADISIGHFLILNISLGWIIILKRSALSYCLEMCQNKHMGGGGTLGLKLSLLLFINTNDRCDTFSNIFRPYLRDSLLKF